VSFRLPGVRRARNGAAIGVAIVLLGLVPAALPASAAPAPDPVPERPAVPGELLVTMDPGRAPGSLVTGLLPGLLGIDVLSGQVALVRTLTGLESVIAGRLLGLPGVAAVEANRRLDYLAAPNDPYYADQWAHQLVDAEEAWNVETGTAQTTIAVLDSGIDGYHEELANIVLRADASTGSVRAGNVDNDLCEIGHGTMVAGVLGALGDNGTGIAGVNWNVALLDIALSSPDADCGGPTDAAVIAALDYLAHRVERPVSAVNMSFGAPDDRCPQAYQAAIDEARTAGMVLVAASGNEEEVPGLAGQPQIPASCNGVISVGATGPDGGVAPYSTRNSHVDLAAPGGDRSDGGGRSTLVVTTARGGGYTAVEGSSFSSPYVAGLAALLRAADPTLTATQVEAVLEATARDGGEPGRDSAYGWGLVDAAEAMRRVAARDIPALQPDPTFPTGGETNSTFFARSGPSGGLRLPFRRDLLRVP
jgi:subtilisin family serine protease